MGMTSDGPVSGLNVFRCTSLRQRRQHTKKTIDQRTSMGSNICCKFLILYEELLTPYATQFIGTSLALAIPLVILRRQHAVLQMALKDKNPPPRRTASSSSSSLRRPASLPTSPNTSLSVENNLSADPDQASLNMMSALSHVNSSSAMLAAKAFAIATGMVAIGGAVFIWGVKETLGVKDVKIDLRMPLRSIS